MTSVSADQGLAGGSNPRDWLEQLIAFEGAPEEFLAHLLTVQCRIGQAAAGALLRLGQGNLTPLAVFPPSPDGKAPAWLAPAVERCGTALGTGNAEVAPFRGAEEFYGAAAGRHLIILPIRSGGAVRAICVFIMNSRDSAAAHEALRRLELTVCLLALYEMRLTLQRRATDLKRVRRAAEVLVSLNEQQRVKAAGMALCNQVAAMWSAERVTLGIVRGREVRAVAMSHTEKFTRKMELVQAIEAAMDECADQDLEVIHPSPAESTVVSRSAALLSSRHGPMSIVSLPLRRGGEPMAVLTLERSAEEPLEVEDVESLRLMAELISTRVIELSISDRWFGARWASGVRGGLAKLVGPSHTWAKVAAVAVACGLAFALIARGTYKVEGSFTIEATQKQLVSAPYDAYLLSVKVAPGDAVAANQTVLAELDGSQFRLELAEARAQQVGFVKQAEIARRQDKIADAQVAEAEAERLDARMRLLQWKIDQSVLRSPVGGVLTMGDLRKQLGAPVRQGQALFEVAPLDSLRAELAAEEQHVADLRVGQTGELAAVSYPGDRVGFTVERIDPVAQVVDQRNIFKVRLRLDRVPAWLRPGMEGTGKVNVDQRTYAAIWTRDLLNWVRMKLWL